jgi:hypothetical protein
VLRRAVSNTFKNKWNVFRGAEAPLFHVEFVCRNDCPVLKVIDHAIISLIRSKPLTPVGDPPANEYRRDCRCQGPPDRQGEISYQSKNREADPEDFLLHGNILVRNFG